MRLVSVAAADAAAADASSVAESVDAAVAVVVVGGGIVGVAPGVGGGVQDTLLLTDL